MKQSLYRALCQTLCLCVLLAVCACTQAKFLAANIPTELDDVKTGHDIAYGSDPLQKLDVYLPASAPGAPNKQRDVIVFFYGGRWTYGSKSDYRFVGTALAAKGYVVVIPDYRKYPQVRFPTFVEDGAKAVAWVSNYIGLYGVDPKHIHIVGHSAGAHIGALLTADARYLAAEGKNRSDIIYDFVGLAGPYSFTPDEPDLKAIFGDPQDYPAMRVTNFIDGKQPPMLLLYGNMDKDVKPENTEKLKNAVKDKGGCVKVIPYKGADHNALVSALSWYNPKKLPVLDDMTHFFGTSCAPQKLFE